MDFSTNKVWMESFYYMKYRTLRQKLSIGKKYVYIYMDVNKNVKLNGNVESIIWKPFVEWRNGWWVSLDCRVTI